MSGKAQVSGPRPFAYSSVFDANSWVGRLGDQCEQGLGPASLG